MKMMSYLNLFILTLSCSHQVKSKKSIKLTFSEELLQEVLTNSTRTQRRPADENLTKSNQRIYFSTLYYQYKTLGQYLTEKSPLESCPQYHHDRLEVDSYYLPEIYFSKVKNLREEKRDYFPENTFSHPEDLLSYYESIESEVRELCERGFSDNFYKYDNLITYHVGRKEFHESPRSMRALLNIPIFANYYLISMMRSPYEIDYTPAGSKEFIFKARATWFENYVSSAQKGRREIFAKR